MLRRSGSVFSRSAVVAILLIALVLVQIAIAARVIYNRNVGVGSAKFVRRIHGDQHVAAEEHQRSIPKANNYVPVFVMMPLDLVLNNNTLNNPAKLQAQLKQLKSANVDGVMTDVWWGIVESSPQAYDWSAYLQFVEMCAEIGLKVQVVMSFHQCGGNVGDNCDIPLPSWVLEVGDSNPDIFYTDQHGNRDREYLSSGVDDQSLFPTVKAGTYRTAVDMYADYMASFRQNFAPYLGSTIVLVEVGMGPAGELRYPSYQESLWQFPGIGEFQCYDKYLLARLQNAATAAGQSDWGTAGPDNAGTYNDYPYNTGFFSTSGWNNFQSPYGQFFLNWYAQNLIDHGDAILSQAAKIFAGTGVELAGKIAGIHWWYMDVSHAAELTAGYYNLYGLDGYLPIAKMFAKHGATFDFTCLEMLDSSQPSNCACGPQELVTQTQNSVWSINLPYAGENALTITSQGGYSQVESVASRNGHTISAFSLLRLTDSLLQGNNWSMFTSFVNAMHNL